MYYSAQGHQEARGASTAQNPPVFSLHLSLPWDKNVDLPYKLEIGQVLFCCVQQSWQSMK